MKILNRGHFEKKCTSIFFVSSYENCCKKSLKYKNWYAIIILEFNILRETKEGKMIEVKDLTKVYKTIQKESGLTGYFKNLIHPKYQEYTAVDHINFSIKEGELVGYIGENGAGKSTTIKMLTGLLSPTFGEVIVDGRNPSKNRLENNQKIGAVFGQKTQLWWDLPVIESFRLIKKLYQIPENEYRRNLKKFTQILQLEDLLEKQVKNLSLGQKMRCELAVTFLHNPKVVYLDEPTIGLDVLVKERIRQFIKDINKEKNTTVILTTHDLKDIEDVCNRIILLDKGRIIYDGQKESFKNQYGKDIVAQLKINHKTVELIAELTNLDFQVIEEDSTSLVIQFNHEQTNIMKIVEKLSKYCDIQDLNTRQPELEDILKEIYIGEKIC